MGDIPGKHFERLGKRELGRHAFEERMPERITKFIAKEDNQNATFEIIPKLALLLTRSPDVEAAYLCTEHAVQVHKLSDEGAHFCGYRNIQMLCLALGRSGYSKVGDVDLQPKLNIPQLQDLVERAWDQGINAHGRIQTGGIKGTRKHVGTSEAETLLLHIKIPCTGTAFNGEDAWSRLLDHVETYYENALSDDTVHQKVNQTSGLPIFLQRPQHSVTIVGIVKLKSGKRKILVFDPAWKPPSTIIEVRQEWKRLSLKETLVLSRYCKSERYLKRFSAFETLTVEATSE